MDTLRRTRIADISNYDLEFANQSLEEARGRLGHLNTIPYQGDIPKDLFFDIHLTVDDIHLLEKRIGNLLDKQLDDYHSSSPSYSWDKKEACRLLKAAVDQEPVMIPLHKLISVLDSSLWAIGKDDKLDALKNFCVILGTEGYISIPRAKEILDECCTY